MSLCYLAEWYRPELCAESLADTAAKLQDCAASLSAQGTPVKLLTIVAVPTEDFAFGIFTAAAAGTVAEACQQAGMPAQRLTAAVDAPSPAPHS